MIYRKLGRTKLEVSILGLGTGGHSRFGQTKGLSLQEQTALVRRCLDLGINFFDTSEEYGESEAILGKTLVGVSRDSYIICTKWCYYDGDVATSISNSDVRNPKALIASVNRSLDRLRINRIDIMLFHGLVPSQYKEVVNRFQPAMEMLKKEGKVKFWGFSERFLTDPFHKTTILALKSHPELWDTIMLKYGILNQLAAEQALPLALDKGVGIINMAAVREKLPNQNKLEESIADWKKRGLVPETTIPTANPLGWLISKDVNSVISAGYKFAADHPAISTVLSGTANIGHLESNVLSMEQPYLPDKEKHALIKLFGKITESG